jgi:hypothetical protein
MKLILEYDPWADRQNALRAAEALKTLGMPVTLREVRASLKGNSGSEKAPVAFEPAE